jgi:phosphoribosylanthranilate isomerase
MRVRVKICGITSLEDGLFALEAGADALGFVFCAASPRNLTVARAAGIIKALPPLVAKVGVFVNPTPEFVQEVLEQCGIDTVQLHGEESPAFCRQFRAPVIKAFRVRDESSLKEMPAYTGEAWLLDSYVSGRSGGTGERFNWELARRATAASPRVILAGGLTAGNVVEAVQSVQPYAVDVSSGVEIAPGKKDPGKVRAFISAVKGLPEPDKP